MALATRRLYHVVLYNGQWSIRYKGNHYGPYASRQVAIDTVRDLIYADMSRHIVSRALIQGEDTKFHSLVQTLGQARPSSAYC